MAAALLDASLVVMLGVVTVSDLRTRLVPDGPLVAGLALALGLCGLFAPRPAAGAARRRRRGGGLPARRRPDPPGWHGARRRQAGGSARRLSRRRRRRGDGGGLRRRVRGRPGPDRPARLGGPRPHHRVRAPASTLSARACVRRWRSTPPEARTGAILRDRGRASVLAAHLRSGGVTLRFTTAGESHGPGLVAIVEGMPAGLELDREALDREMARRQLGHGRGGRMKIESDTVEIRSGVRHGRTLGSPIAVLVANRDYPNWDERMNPWPVDAEVEETHLPRPGHADLAGLQKFGFTDVRNVLERASARETAARVAAGSIAKGFLDAVGVQVYSHVIQIASVSAPQRDDLCPRGLRGRRRLAGAQPRPGRLAGDGGGDRPPAEGERVARRQVRGARLRARPGHRLARLLEREARRTAGAGDLLDPVGQGCLARRGLGRRRAGPARRPTTRSSGPRIAAGTARPTGPAAWRAG